MKPNRYQDKKGGSVRWFSVAREAGRTFSTDFRFEVAVDCSQYNPSAVQRRKSRPPGDLFFREREELVHERVSSARYGISAPGSENQRSSVNEPDAVAKIFSRCRTSALRSRIPVPRSENRPQKSAQRDSGEKIRTRNRRALPRAKFHNLERPSFGVAAKIFSRSLKVMARSS